MAEKKKKDTFKWFRELRSEFKKIVWPGKKQIKNNTIVTLVMVVVMAGVIALFDLGIRQLANFAIPSDDDYQVQEPVDNTEKESEETDKGTEEESEETAE